MKSTGSICALALALALVAGGPALSAVPERLSCPNEARIDLRPVRDGGPESVREIAPKAGGATSQDLADLARHPRLAYELYDVFESGADLPAAFAKSGLTLVGFIYGDPGPQGDRLAKRRPDGRTFYGFVADDPASQTRVIAFRGTLQPNEWVRNIQARQSAYAGGAKVHEGFLAIFQTLTFEAAANADALGEALPSLVGGRKTAVVGHSLGAALATLAGVDAARRAPDQTRDLRVVTIASPRVGDAGFAALARQVPRIDRVCNLVDVVPAVPPSGPDGRYTHVGTTFKVSSFDWPELNNAVPKAVDQILCWHGDAAYAYMLAPAKSASALGQCAR